MVESNNINSKNINEIDLFLNNILSRLGLNHANLGTRYLRELIKIAYSYNMLDIKYKDLCNILGKKLKVNVRKIDSNIYSAVNSININIARKNFQAIFNIEFDYFYISPKKLTILLLNLVYNSF